MTYTEYTVALSDKIKLLTYDEQLDWALEISEKLFFDYQFFFEKYQWGDPNVLLDGITLSKQSKINEIDLNTLRLSLQKIDGVTPHMDDFGDEISSYALNAAASVYETLEFIQDKDHGHIYNIANYYHDTVDFRIQEKETLTEDQINNHDLMVKTRHYLLASRQ